MEDFRTNHTHSFQSIRAFCIQCHGYQPLSVKRCEVFNCVLWPFRMGHRPSQDSKLIPMRDALRLMQERHSTKGVEAPGTTISDPAILDYPQKDNAPNKSVQAIGDDLNAKVRNNGNDEIRD